MPRPQDVLFAILGLVLVVLVAFDLRVVVLALLGAFACGSIYVFAGMMPDRTESFWQRIFISGFLAIVLSSLVLILPGTFGLKGPHPDIQKTVVVIAGLHPPGCDWLRDHSHASGHPGHPALPWLPLAAGRAPMRLFRQDPHWPGNRNGTCSLMAVQPGDGAGLQRLHVSQFLFRQATAKGSIMSALIGILITFLVVILVLYLVNMLPIDGRAKQIVRIIVIIIGILSLLKYLGVWI